MFYLCIYIFTISLWVTVYIRMYIYIYIYIYILIYISFRGKHLCGHRESGKVYSQMPKFRWGLWMCSRFRIARRPSLLLPGRARHNEQVGSTCTNTYVRVYTCIHTRMLMFILSSMFLHINHDAGWFTHCIRLYIYYQSWVNWCRRTRMVALWETASLRGS